MKNKIIFFLFFSTCILSAESVLTWPLSNKKVQTVTLEENITTEKVVAIQNCIILKRKKIVTNNYTLHVQYDKISVLYTNLFFCEVAEGQKHAEGTTLGETYSKKVLINLPNDSLNILQINEQNIFSLPIKEYSNIYSIFSGIVTNVGYDSNFGKFIDIYSETMDITVRYAHLSNTRFMRNNKVKQGELIGSTGFTGDIENPQLTFLFLPFECAVFFIISDLIN